MRKFGSILLFSGLMFSTAVAFAAPRDELLRLVPDSVGFCLVIQDLRGHAATLRESPFIQQMSQSPFGVKIRSSEGVKKLDRFESKMKEKLGLDWVKLREDILGDALVLAYEPGPPGKPEQEQGVLLLRARNEKTLADLIERINAVQKEEGELKEIERCRHNDTVYFKRLECDKLTKVDKPPSYYYLHGPVLVVSPQESMIRRILDLERARASKTTPSGSASAPQGGEQPLEGKAARQLRELDAERSLLAVWINPRAFDAALEAKIADAPAERLTAVKQFAVYWKALESVVVSLTPSEHEINIALGMRARVEALPPAARQFFADAAIPSDVWRRFPDSALAAVGGRFEGPALLEVIGGFLTPQQRQSMNAAMNRQLQALLGEDDFVGQVLPALGPDWGLCVRAPLASDKNWMPHALFALRVDGKRSKKAIEPKLLGLLDFAARLAIFLHNAQQSDRSLALKTGEVGGREVRYLAGDLPPGVQPAYGLLNGYLLLSTSLEEINRFSVTAPASPSSAGSIPLLRISLKDWRTYIKQRRDPIVQFLAANYTSSPDEAARRVDGFLTGLQFIDRVELRRRSNQGRMVLHLSIQSAHALKK
jgi:hypothetical protein